MKNVALEVQLAICVLLALLFMMVASLAAETAAPERPRTACAADYKRFCSAVKLGEGRIAQCLQSHAGELSDQCKASLKAAEAARSSGKASAK